MAKLKVSEWEGEGAFPLFRDDFREKVLHSCKRRGVIRGVMLTVRYDCFSACAVLEKNESLDVN